MGAPLATNFPQGFANGVILRGLPILQAQPGRAFWLSNNGALEPGEVAGSDSNRGTFYRPFATLSGALADCVGGNGDIIFVKPGHAETISSSTALNMSVSDVAIVGLGVGAKRPKFTLDTANTSTVNVTGEGVSFQNCQFVANFLNIAALYTFADASVTASITGGIMNVTAVGSGTLYVGNTIKGTGVPSGTVILGQLSGTTGGVGTYLVSTSTTVASTTITTSTKGFSVDNCCILDTSTVLNFLTLFSLSTTDNASDGLTITNNYVELLATSGVVNLLAMNANLDQCAIMGNTYFAATTNAGALIPFASGKKVTGFRLIGNTITMVNAAATATGIIITSNTSGSTGLIDNNTMFSLANTTLSSSLLVTAGTGIRFGTNRYCRSADKSAVTSLPALDT